MLFILIDELNVPKHWVKHNIHNRLQNILFAQTLSNYHPHSEHPQYASSNYANTKFYTRPMEHICFHLTAFARMQPLNPVFCSAPCFRGWFSSIKKHGTIVILNVGYSSSYFCLFFVHCCCCNPCMMSTYVNASISLLPPPPKSPKLNAFASTKSMFAPYAEWWNI